MYTMEDFKRAYIIENIARLTLADQREALLLPAEELLAGLSEEQIRRFLELLAADRANQPREPRRKR